MNSENITQVSTVFVILRCLRNEKDRELWRRCYTSIRYYYSETPIVIIDDNSLLEDEMDSRVLNTTILKSDFSMNIKESGEQNYKRFLDSFSLSANNIFKLFDMDISFA